jgi:hypothetical protein
MKQATIEDKKTVLRILENSFLDNPTLLFLIRNPERRQFYIRRIAEYAFDFAIRRNGVYLSDSGLGVAICFQYDFMKRDLLDYWNMFKMVVSAFRIRRLISIFRHTKTVERFRPENGDYLYFWFFGVAPDETPRVSARELSLQIMEMAERNKKDIYAETTLLKNRRVYERFGFEVYHSWFNPENGIQVWFMRKSCQFAV